MTLDADVQAMIDAAIAKIAAPDLSSYATKTDLAAIAGQVALNEAAIAALQGTTPPPPPPPSGLPVIPSGLGSKLRVVPAGTPWGPSASSATPTITSAAPAS